MIEIEDKIISRDLFEKKFVCDLQSCKGACCIEGNSGAPLTSKELVEIKSNLSIIKTEMSSKGIDVIDRISLAKLQKTIAYKNQIDKLNHSNTIKDPVMMQ